MAHGNNFIPTKSVTTPGTCRRIQVSSCMLWCWTKTQQTNPWSTGPSAYYQSWNPTHSVGTSCSLSGFQLSALRWVSQFLPFCDCFAVVYLLHFQSNEPGKAEVQTQRPKLSPTLNSSEERIPSITSKAMPVFWILDASDVVDLRSSELVSTAFASRQCK